MSDRERGFTLVEILVAVAVAVLLAAFILRTSVEALHWTSLQAARDAEHEQVDRLVDRLQADEDSAWAIFTPSSDLFGRSNADGHELDFYSRDNRNQAYFWAYAYDASAKTLTRYRYASLGALPVSGETFDGIDAFYAHTYPVTALADPASKVYSPLYAGAVLRSGAVTFVPGSAVAGGNQLTYVRLQSPTLVRELQLSTQTAPSGFIVEVQYTPAPTPTPQIALSAWPQYVELPMNGAALQAAWASPPRDVAYYVNRLLGGGIAQAAATPCATNQGRAFTDGTFSTPLSNAAAPSGALPAGVTAYTDAGGCIFFQSATFTNGMPNVAIWEPGYTGVFSQTQSSCGAGVHTTYAYPPAQNGPHMQVVSTGGALPIVSCVINWFNATGAQQAQSTYEVSGCSATGIESYQLVGIGAKCDVGSAWLSATPDCSPGGSGGVEYTPRGITIAGPGQATDNGDGTFRLTRTGKGSIQATYNFTALMCNGRRTKIQNESTSYDFTD